jgi:hypothetical protein
MMAAVAAFCHARDDGIHMPTNNITAPRRRRPRSSETTEPDEEENNGFLRPHRGVGGRTYAQQ